jgi:hypothetical protein
MPEAGNTVPDGPQISKPQSGLRRLARRILPYAGTALALIWILHRISLRRLAVVLATADYGPFLLLMGANAAIYFLWDTAVLTLATRWFHGPVRYRDVLPVRAAAYIAATVNAEVGGGTTAVYLARQAGDSVWSVAGTVVFLTLVEFTQLAAWMTLGWLLHPELLPRILLLAPAGLAAFWLAMFLSKRGRRWQKHPGTELPQSLPGRWSKFRHTFQRVRPVQWLLLLLVKAPLVAVAAVFHFWGARCFDLHLPPGMLLAGLPTIFLLAALPVSVAHLGTTQAAWIFFFGRFASPERLLAFSLAAHLSFVLTRACLGALLLPRAIRELLPLAEQALPAIVTVRDGRA